MVLEPWNLGSALPPIQEFAFFSQCIVHGLHSIFEGNSEQFILNCQRTVKQLAGLMSKHLLILGNICEILKIDIYTNQINRIPTRTFF